MPLDNQQEIDAFLGKYSEPEDPRPKGPALWLSEEGWDELAIPSRPWIARGYFLRRAITVVSGAGSAGKSSLVVSWTTCLALGLPFHRMQGVQDCKPVRVMAYNVEDDLDELRRRYSAVLRQVNRSPQQLMQRLTLIGPNGSGALLIVDPAGGYIANTPAMNRLEEEVALRKPDVLFLDPFVELHGADENDNTAVRAVLARFRAMAVEHDMAVVLLHHSRKGVAAAGDPDTMRGASAIAGAARVVLTLNVMTIEEAKAFGIAGDRRRYFARLDGAKMNYSPIGEAEWFERVSYTLDNGPLQDEDGDGVGALCEWSPPVSMASDDSLDRLEALIGEGTAEGPYSHRLSSDARSVRTALVRAGIAVPAAQKAAMDSLLMAGRVALGNYKRTGKGDMRQGLRTAAGEPSHFHWGD